METAGYRGTVPDRYEYLHRPMSVREYDSVYLSSSHRDAMVMIPPPRDFLVVTVSAPLDGTVLPHGGAIGQPSAPISDLDQPCRYFCMCNAKSAVTAQPCGCAGKEVQRIVDEGEGGFLLGMKARR